MLDFTKKNYNIFVGDCLDVLKKLPDNCVDSVVTDPPYGLSFMGKAWDHSVPSTEVWIEVLRVLKPGGHLLCFAGTRTQHRMAVAIEDAGFEIRDMIAWVYSSGFPKSLDVSKALDKAAGAKREVVGQRKSPYTPTGRNTNCYGQYDTPTADDGYLEYNITTPATEAARQWDGWGTALKPALEPITVARKPLTGTVADNVIEYGTGALNIDGCRVGTEEELGRNNNTNPYGSGRTWNVSNTPPQNNIGNAPPGRWPANLIHDGSDEVTALFPDTVSGKLEPHHNLSENRLVYGKYNGKERNRSFGGDSGSAARFFYCAKASKKDRGENNIHPTVKPTDLLQYLCRLVTPPEGIVLDPFLGSGSTGKACANEGFKIVGIEIDQDYADIAKKRISKEYKKGGKLKWES